MILFVTGQYAGAQYIDPLLQKWNSKGSAKWQLVATGSSCKYWEQHGVSYVDFKKTSSDEISQFLDLMKPALVVVSASANIELEYLFILEAKKKNIPSASFIDIWNNYSARFRYKGKVVYPDYVLAIDQRCAEELNIEGVPQNIIKIIGQPYLEKHTTDVPDLGENLLIASQPIRKHYRQSLGYDERDFLNVCLKAVKQLKLKHVYVTRHPDEESNIVQPCLDGVMWATGKGLVDVANSHTVLSMFSMQMIIGYLWGRKVISIQPGLCKNDQSPLSRWGLIPKLNSYEEFAEYIKEPFEKNNNIALNVSLKGSTERFESFCLTG